MFKIKKAPKSYLVKNPRGVKRVDIPLEKMKVGEMIEAPNKQKNRTTFYNMIKHRRNYTRECEGWVFTIKVSPDKKTIACIRLK